MGDKNKRAARELASLYSIGTLAGALIGRLTLDRRVDDATGLARLLTEQNMVDQVDEDLAVRLAQDNRAAVLADALLGRLTNDGRGSKCPLPQCPVRGLRHRQRRTA